jgi:hypothetical protein
MLPRSIISGIRSLEGKVGFLYSVPSDPLIKAADAPSVSSPFGNAVIA